ncbi:MAG: tetratricopeptide repeat protein [Acidobacteriota bacterium]
MKNSIGKLMMAAVIMTILGCVVPGFGQTVDERIGRALAAINKDDLGSAATDISEVLKADPKNATAYYLRGMIDFKQAKYDEALADQTKAIELNTNANFPQFYFERGLTYQYRTTPDYKLALADFSKAIQIAPSYKSAYEKRAWSNFSLQNWTAAESDYSQAIKLGSSTLAVYANRAVANLNLKNYDQSMADSRKALEIDPTNAVVKENLDLAIKLKGPASSGPATDAAAVADLLKRAADAKKAGDTTAQEKYLNAAVKADPKNYDAIEQRLFLYDATDKKDLAIADAGRLIEIDPTNLDGYYLRASLNVGKKEYEKAIPDYTSQLGLKLTSDQTASTYYRRGVAYRKTLQYDKAAADFSKAIDLHPGYKSALSDRAEIYEFGGEYDGAEADLKALQKLDPGNKFAESELANIKMFRKVGFNTGAVKENTLFKLNEYVDLLTEDSDMVTKNLSQITQFTNEDPKNTAKICVAVANTDLVTKITDSDAALLARLVTDGKLDKLPTIKTMVEGLLKSFPDNRAMVNADAAKYGCKLN